MKHTKSDLQQMQSLPLSAKIQMTKRRIKDWYDYFDGQVYVSFSGGKDSTILVHIARELYPDIEAVFVNTGLEYPEIQQFVKTFDNVTILRPKMRFDEVIKTYGYPVISKAVANAIDTYQTKVRNGKPLTGARIEQLLGTYEGNRHDGKKSKFDKSKYKPLLDLDCKVSDRCCGIMKKAPLKSWEKVNKKYPIVATMAEESIMREAVWLKTGCNGFDMKRPMSKPMSFWTEQDVYQYIKQYNIPIASVYGDIVYENDNKQMRLEDYGITECGTDNLKTTGCERTGCIFCGFGCHLDKRGQTRFQQLKETHPKQYEYCIGGGEYVNGEWQPSKKGLGMGHVFDELNKIYGDDFIKY